MGFNKKFFRKTVLMVLLGMISFYLILLFVIYPSSIPGKESIIYETVEKFKEAKNIPFYRIYSLYDYIMEDKRTVLGEEKDCLIKCQERSNDTYNLIENEKHSYHIFYGRTTIDENGYYKKIGDSKFNIIKQPDYLWVLYNSPNVSYDICLYEEIKEEDYYKIEEYIKEVEKLNIK